MNSTTFLTFTHNYSPYPRLVKSHSFDMRVCDSSAVDYIPDLTELQNICSANDEGSVAVFVQQSAKCYQGELHRALFMLKVPLPAIKGVLCVQP